MERRTADLYGGPLEEFVRRRDALAKDLRAAGDRDGAAAVKRLRKPSRQAWALDLAATGDAGIEPLVEAVAETIDAQARNHDVRGAMARLREAVRAFASDAAQAAQQAGHTIEAAELGSAVLAVLGRPESFAQLRGGYLAEVPEGGGLDILASLPLPPAARDVTAATRGTTAVDGEGQSSSRAGVASATSRGTAAAARAAERAAKALERARAQADTARRAVEEAEAQVQHAEARVAEAEAQARAARERLGRARSEADTAAAHVQEAERAAADAARSVDAS